MRVTFVLLAAILSCATRPPVRGDVERGVPATQLRIHLVASDSTRPPVPVDQIEVTSRSRTRRGGPPGPLRWSIARRRGAPALPLPAIIPFGTVPEGFGDSGPAIPLPNGQYQLRVLAGGVWSVTSFRVTDDNRIE